MTTPINIFVGEQQFRQTVQLRFAEPVALPQTTKAALASAYPASSWSFCTVAITDGTSNKFLAISNGVAWYYMDGTLV